MRSKAQTRRPSLVLKRLNKTDKTIDAGPSRVLVVDDHPEAAKLLGKLLRRSGYEVAEVADDQVVLLTLTNEATPIIAVVASFSYAGTGAALKLLDGIRHAPEPRVNQCRVIVVADSSSQLMFAWQSGADAIIERPYSSAQLVSELDAAIERTNEERTAHRAEHIARLREVVSAAATRSGFAAEQG